MDSEPIKIWLRKKRRKEMAVAVSLGGVSLLGGLVLKDLRSELRAIA